MNDFKIILEAMIDNSSLTNVQKQLAKERLKVSADIDFSNFVSEKQKIQQLANEINKILGDSLKPKDALSWANQYWKQMQSGARQAQREQDKLNQAQKKGSLATQEKYYQRIISNNKTIYSLKEKLLHADEKQSREIQNQITKLEKRNQYNSNQLSKKGLTDNSWEWEVNTSKEVLENRLRINQEKQKDVALSKQIADVDKIQHSLDVGDYDVEVSILTSKFQKWGLSVEEVENKMSALNTAYANLSKKGLTNDQRIKAEKEYQLALEKTNNELKLMSLNSASRTDRTNLSNKIKVWLDKNTKASKEARIELQKYVATLDSVDDIGNPALQKIKSEFTQIEIAERSAGRLGKSFIDTLKAGAQKFVEWGLASNAVMAVWSKSKEMVQAVYDIDTAMTNLYKVTDETAERYDQFLDSASKKAKELGQSVTNLVEQTANWAKLGYSLDDAEKLAEISSIYSNVGEVDNDTAVSDMITAMKAFNIEASDAITIVDRLNALGNKYATSAADLGTGLSNSASSLALAGNSIDETLAMITAMTEITQDASESGNALKILSMRLRGMKGELEALGEESKGLESISKIQTQILNLTDGKVNIFDDTGNFKSTYEIMQGISEVWTEISQTDQAQLLEIIAGKQRGNSISALLTNMAQANNALNDSINSSGSAYQEQERWMESLEAKTQKFEAAFQSLSTTILDSDLLKGIVDFGTVGVSAIDSLISSFGSLNTLTTIGAGILGGKGHGLTNYVTHHSLRVPYWKAI